MQGKLSLTIYYYYFFNLLISFRIETRLEIEITIYIHMYMVNAKGTHHSRIFLSPLITPVSIIFTLTLCIFLG